MTWDVFGLTFNLYGLILGLAMVVAFYLAESKGSAHDLPKGCVWKIGGTAILFGIVGARLWHVGTDFHLYQGNLWSAAAIWQGGLSILGGIVGGALGLVIGRRVVKECRQRPMAFFTDLAAFALPAAQGLGRLANWVNGELYGLPTNLPWKIYISAENRLPGYENTSHYHPLFLYEMAAMLSFTAWIWVFDQKNTDEKRRIGTGFYTWIYLVYYAFIRFCLDFLRLDKAMVASTALGLNQLILALFLLVMVVFGLKKGFLKASGKWISTVILGFVILASVWSLSQSTQPEVIGKNLSNFQLGKQTLLVEVVSKPEDMALGLSGRREIGSDGMLFIFPQPTRATFWMKDMLFDLDMIWIRNGRVVDITYQVPKPSPGEKLVDLPTYSPFEPADMILEIPVGKANELNIATGSAAFLVN